MRALELVFISGFLPFILAVPASRCVQTVTVKTTKSVTKTEHTVFTPIASTSYIFRSGSPPDTSPSAPSSTARAAQEDASSTISQPSPTTSSPEISTISTCAVTRTSTVKTTATTTVTKTRTARPHTVRTTVYPCASPVDYQGPTYGDANGTEHLGLSNTLYYTDTPEGASPQSCCDLCFFGLADCVQAYWYFYEGCVVSQATNFANASHTGISKSCPSGTFDGLSYGPDKKPAFRSTGNIAGPCGQVYTNF